MTPCQDHYPVLVSTARTETRPSVAAPASPAVRVEGQMLPTTHRFGEVVVKLQNGGQTVDVSLMEVVAGIKEGMKRFPVIPDTDPLCIKSIFYSSYGIRNFIKWFYRYNRQ